MVFKSVVGLLLTGFMSTRDTLLVAQTCLHAVPLFLLEGANDDEEVKVLSDENDERGILLRVNHSKN